MVRDYLKLLQSLLPKGVLWNRLLGSVMTELLHGMSVELNRIDERAYGLLKERDTRTTIELLGEHENDLGLPDDCSQSGETIQERRDLAHSKTIARGQQDKGYFISLAAALGHTINIIEHTPFWSGVGAAGDPCGDQTNIFYWTVQVDGTGQEVYFTSGNSQSGDSLLKIAGIETLSCIIEKYKPAHTVVNFEFVGPGFSSGFSSGFYSLPSSLSLTGGFNKFGFSSGFEINTGGGFDFGGFSSGFDKPN